MSASQIWLAFALLRYKPGQHLRSYGSAGGLTLGIDAFLAYEELEAMLYIGIH